MQTGDLKALGDMQLGEILIKLGHANSGEINTALQTSHAQNILFGEAVVRNVPAVVRDSAPLIDGLMGPSFFEKEMFGRTVHFRLLAPFMLILEIPLDLARIATLAVRLLANMFADHTVVAVWLTLVPIGVPAIFMGLGLVISFLQAFIFALLTMIYIGLALDEPH